MVVIRNQRCPAIDLPIMKPNIIDFVFLLKIISVDYFRSFYVCRRLFDKVASLTSLPEILVSYALQQCKSIYLPSGSEKNVISPTQCTSIDIVEGNNQNFIKRRKID